LPNTDQRDVVTGQPDSYQRLTVPVQISGRGPYRFVVDTGSQKSVVARHVADELSLERGAQERIIGLTGPEMVETATVAELGIGRRRHRNLDVVIFDAQNIGADGIIGIDSLQGQRVLLDFGRNLMTVGDARSLGGDDVMIDTGSDTTIANRALQRALNKRDALTPVILISASGQTLVADIGIHRRLEIASIGIANLLVAYTDAPVFAALGLDRRPAMMLGMRELRLFPRIAIDFSRQKVYFDLPPPE